MSKMKCVCKGNWRLILSEYERLIGRKYRYVWNGPDHGKTYTFFGLVNGYDDFYYGMIGDESSQLRLLTCVGSPEGMGFELIPGKSLHDEMVG